VKTSGFRKNASVAASQGMKEAATRGPRGYQPVADYRDTFWLRLRFVNQDTFVCCHAAEKTPSGRFFAKTTVNEPRTRRRTMN
jgi:hypothetical protein